jgi:hypothetical protein
MSQASDLIAGLKQQDEEVEALQLLWKAYLPEFKVPEQRQVRLWLREAADDFRIVKESIECGAKKHNHNLSILEEMEAEGRQPTKEEITTLNLTSTRMESYVNGAIKNKVAESNE